jgi:eukaryotic-like serine/threonine-protein kinase
MVSRSISHYCISKKLGAGGMGEVYLAEDTRLDRQVALKILPEEFAGDAERMRRFVHEAKAASALNHPNILTIYEIGEADGEPYLATEFIEGETLRHHIEHSRMKVREVLEATVQVASALSAAHQAGIVHRDIKPENVMLRPDGYVKLLDFGLAKLTEKQALTTNSDAATISQQATDPGFQEVVRKVGHQQ